MLKGVRDHIPPVLYRLWTTESSKHSLKDGTWRFDLNTKNKINSRAHLEKDLQLDSMYDLGEGLKSQLGFHLEAERGPSFFTSWTHSLLAVLSRARSLFENQDAKNIFITIMITSCFEDKEIYWVPDIYEFGYNMSGQNRGYSCTYVVHGTISGPGLGTIRLSTLVNDMGFLWEEIPTTESWFDVSKDLTGAWSNQNDCDGHPRIDDRFQTCVKVVQETILPEFATQPIEYGTFKFMELYITAQFYCMRVHYWFHRIINDLSITWVQAMCEPPSPGELTGLQRSWGGGIIPKIHSALSPRRTRHVRDFPDVQETLFLLGNFGRVLMDYGKTSMDPSTASGKPLDISQDDLVPYLGVMLELTFNASKDKYHLSEGWKDPGIDYWTPFALWKFTDINQQSKPGGQSEFA